MNHDALSYFSQFAEILEAMPDAVVVVNKAGVIVVINRQAETLFGYSCAELLGQTVECMMPMPFRTHHVVLRNNYMKHPSLRRMGKGLELAGLKKDGTEFPIEISLNPLHAQAQLFIIATIRDFSEQKKREAQLKYFAEHDHLTGFINKMILQDRIEQSKLWSQRHKRCMAVCFVDIDDFKRINDCYGHAIGDQVLISAAACFNDCLRSFDTKARIGGDEFVFVLSELSDGNAALNIMKKIARCFAQGFEVDHHKITVTLSIGIGLYPEQGDQSLLDKADSAMYYVKKHGKNNIHVADTRSAMLSEQKKS